MVWLIAAFLCLSSFAGAVPQLSEGDYWEYLWRQRDHTWAQGSSPTSSVTEGKFRITLGSPVVVEGVTLFKILLNGQVPEDQKEWAYIGTDGSGQFLARADGISELVTLLDPGLELWFGDGFMIALNTQAPVSASISIIDNRFVRRPAIRLGSNYDQGYCEIIEGRRICPNDSSMSISRNEFWDPELGCLGVESRYTYSFSGGGFSSGGGSDLSIGLVASSLLGDPDQIVYETEPNRHDSPNPLESNQSIIGFIDPDDPAESVTIPYPSGDVRFKISDVYRFISGRTGTLEFLLTWDSVWECDLNLLLFDAQWNLIGESRIAGTNGMELIVEENAPTGTYYLSIAIASDANVKYQLADIAENSTGLGVQSIWPKAQEYADGWFDLGWFGWINKSAPFPWFLHAEHGWILADPERTQYIYDLALDCYLWISEDIYPWFYKFGTYSGWYYYYAPWGSPGKRWFYDSYRKRDLLETSFYSIDIHSYVKIPAGSFVMGSPVSEPERDDDETQHQVTLTRALLVQEIEATNRQVVEVLNWAHQQGFVTVNSSKVFNDEGDVQVLLDMDFSDTRILWNGLELEVLPGLEDYPCIQVSWYGALAICNYLSRMEALGSESVNFNDWTMDLNQSGYRLPTEAEWEYACRAGTTTSYYTGNGVLDLDKAGWHLGNIVEASEHRGARKERNNWGLYDMHGNVFEWCYDGYTEYGSNPATDPVGSTASPYRILRGGSWISPAGWCRSAQRGITEPYGLSGFRPVRMAGL